MKNPFKKMQLIEDPDFRVNKDLQSDINQILRNNDFDGYVFVPKYNGKCKTGAFIKEIELGNEKLIPTPAMVRYYQKSSGKFFKVLPDEVKL